MKRVIILVIILLQGVVVLAQELKFSKDGELKIVQFTDTHIKLGNDFLRDQSQKCIDLMCAIIDSEKPDVVIFTGDNVTCTPVKEGWDFLLSPLAERKIPFGVVLGNHDREHDMTWAQLSKEITSYPTCINELDGKVLADFAVEVAASDSDSIAALLYLMDSSEYPTVKKVRRSGIFPFEQVENYRTMSEEYTEKNGGEPIPALAFFHIPLSEYNEAYDDKSNPRTGIRGGHGGSGGINTGMCAAFIESGDVFGVFVGHSHNCDYIVGYNGIALAFGRGTLYGTSFSDLRKGSRIIKLKEGKREFESWIHESDGEKAYPMKFEGGKVIKVKK